MDAPPLCPMHQEPLDAAGLCPKGEGECPWNTHVKAPPLPVREAPHMTRPMGGRRPKTSPT